MDNLLLKYHEYDGSPAGNDASLEDVANYYGNMLIKKRSQDIFPFDPAIYKRCEKCMSLINSRTADPCPYCSHPPDGFIDSFYKR